MAEEPCVLGLDVGTTSVKAVLFSLSGAVVGEKSEAYPLQAPHPGWAVQDADLVVDAALTAMSELALTRQRQADVAAISVSTAMHTVLALDGHRRPLTPMVTWADSRGREQAARLRAAPAGRRLAARTGTPIHPMSPLVKLMWFGEHDRGTCAAAAYWVGMKEYLLLHLCAPDVSSGDLIVDRSVASATGLYDLIAGDWNDEALGLAGVRRGQLATLVGTTDQVGRLSTRAAARAGLPSGVPVVAGASDGVLANLGLGAVDRGIVGCSIGTSGALRLTVDRPLPDPAGGLFCYLLDDTHWVVGGATNNGGNVLRWTHQALAPELPEETADEQLVALAAQASAGCDGLLMLPYLAGERAPRWSADARGVYIGLTRQHRRPHLVRAALEGVCLQLGLVLRTMQDGGLDVYAVRATGGFARSRLWRQMLADVLGQEVGYPRSHEGSALGAAILGMRALGLVTSIDMATELVPIVELDKPDPAASATYARVLPLFDSLYGALEPSFAELARLAGE